MSRPEAISVHSAAPKAKETRHAGTGDKGRKAQRQPDWPCPLGPPYEASARDRTEWQILPAYACLQNLHSGVDCSQPATTVGLLSLAKPRNEPQSCETVPRNPPLAVGKPTRRHRLTLKMTTQMQTQTLQKQVFITSREPLRSGQAAKMDQVRPLTWV